MCNSKPQRYVAIISATTILMPQFKCHTPPMFADVVSISYFVCGVSICKGEFQKYYDAIKGHSSSMRDPIYFFLQEYLKRFVWLQWQTPFYFNQVAPATVTSPLEDGLPIGSGVTVCLSATK